MLSFNGDIFIPIMIFSIPIIAVTGGIISGIVKTLGRQRLIELAQRERIAAIERGIDPSKLPPIAGLPAEEEVDWRGRSYNPKHRSQQLMIGGVITLFVGIGLSIFFLVLRPDEEGGRIWGVGLIPGFVGLGLLIASWLVRPKNGDSTVTSGPGGPPPGH